MGFVHAHRLTEADGGFIGGEMCGRFFNHLQSMHDWGALLGDWPAGGVQSYNIAPTQHVPIVLHGRVLQARWGMIPPWAKNFDSKYATHNARVETVAEKPTFRDAWRAQQYCLIPAGGYFEWQKVADGKQPFVVRSDSLILVGLWQAWAERGNTAVKYSFTVLTQPATETMSTLHPRMPCMLTQDPAFRWLKQGLSMPELIDLSIQASKKVNIYPVSREVNSSRAEGASLILPENENISKD